MPLNMGYSQSYLLRLKEMITYKKIIVRSIKLDGVILTNVHPKTATLLSTFVYLDTL